MEEKEKVVKTKKTKESPKMISAEQAEAQIQGVLKEANSKLQQLAMQCRQFEDMLRDKTMDYLFNVLKYEVHFTPEFVEKCSDAISAYLTSMITAPEEQTPAELEKADTSID